VKTEFQLSPQRVDPLSWYTRPRVAGSFGGMSLVYGLGSVVITWRQISAPLLDIVAVAILTAACILVQLRTNPFRSRFRVVDRLAVVALALAGLALSTWANADSTVLVQYWWAPVGVALVLAAMSPYCSALHLLLYGLALTAATVVAGLISFSDTEVWPSASVAVIAASPTLVAAIATSTFAYMVVRRTRELFAGVGAVPAPEEALREEAANTVERHTVARLGARVAPFLERVAENGEIVDDDRALAGQLARRLRADLSERTDRSWLDAVADNGRMFIVDPDRQAERMNDAQRTALRALLTAALRTPGTDAGSLFVELRSRPDGSTAVALSFDLDLPEGRRSMLLAPYYLALQTTVSDLHWDSRRGLLRFGVPRE
jgi:hypothetical protein